MTLLSHALAIEKQYWGYIFGTDTKLRATRLRDCNSRSIKERVIKLLINSVVMALQYYEERVDKTELISGVKQLIHDSHTCNVLFAININIYLGNLQSLNHDKGLRPQEYLAAHDVVFSVASLLCK